MAVFVNYRLVERDGHVADGEGVCDCGGVRQNAIVTRTVAHTSSAAHRVKSSAFVLVFIF
ncbi:MAG: hypothetical protein ACLUFV_06420 [Acutalibacteraceae bacterium]